MNESRAQHPTRDLTRRIALTFGALLAAYVVVRAAVELLTIDYANPAHYRQDWGGPSLAGVLAVHAGPGLVVAGTVATHFYRRAHERRTR